MNIERHLANNWVHLSPLTCSSRDLLFPLIQTRHARTVTVQVTKKDQMSSGGGLHNTRATGGVSSGCEQTRLFFLQVVKRARNHGKRRGRRSSCTRRRSRRTSSSPLQKEQGKQHGRGKKVEGPVQENLLTILLKCSYN